MTQCLRGELFENAETPGADIRLVEASPYRDVLSFSAGEIVHYGHLMAPLEQAVGHVRAHEPGAAGEQDPHRAVGASRRSDGRSANQLRVFSKPSRAGTLGSQPNTSLARVMSGQRRLGSSSGRGSKTTSLGLPEIFAERSITISAISYTLISLGLPMFTGLVSVLFINRKIPSTRSSTYCTLLVWVPSP